MKSTKFLLLILVIVLISGCNTVERLRASKEHDLPFTNYACNKPDTSFSEFLFAFGENKKFQNSRIIFPLVYRSGSFSMANDYGVSTVLLSERELIENQKKYNSVFRSSVELVSEHRKQDILFESEKYAEVNQYLPFADAYSLIYKFTNIEGCWFLEEYHDNSL